MSKICISELLERFWTSQVTLFHPEETNVIC